MEIDPLELDPVELDHVEIDPLELDPLEFDPLYLYIVGVRSCEVTPVELHHPDRVGSVESHPLNL